MSLATEALLIGSYAAQLRDVLPPWRHGQVGDVDLVCTRCAATWIMGLFGTPVVEHAPDRCFRIGRGGQKHIDMDLRGHLLPLAREWADPMAVQINGARIDCLVAQPALILALRAASADVVPKARAKATADVQAYRASGLTVPDRLARVALAFRKPGGSAPSATSS